MSKIFKWADFPAPKPDQYRKDLIEFVEAKINAGQYKVDREKKTVYIDTLIAGENPNLKLLTVENKIDFSNWYAAEGGWRSVTVTTDQTWIKFTFVAK